MIPTKENNFNFGINLLDVGLLLVDNFIFLQYFFCNPASDCCCPGIQVLFPSWVGLWWWAGLGGVGVAQAHLSWVKGGRVEIADSHDLSEYTRFSQQLKQRITSNGDAIGIATLLKDIFITVKYLWIYNIEWINHMWRSIMIGGSKTALWPTGWASRACTGIVGRQAGSGSG